MTRRVVFLPLAALAALSVGAGAPQPAGSLRSPVASAARPAPSSPQPPARLPLAFEPNVGQAAPAVRFQARALGGTAFFTRNGVVLSVATKGRQTVVGVRFVAAERRPRVQGERRLRGVVNYFRGSDRASWQTNIPTFAAVAYRRLYEGVDLRYGGSDGQLESTYTVRAGANAESIRWRYLGAKRVRVDAATGDLVITLAAATLVERAPVAWQEIGSRRVGVPVRYRIGPDGSVGFALGGYDDRRALVIDPTLTWSTYLGGKGVDEGHDIALDASGNVYVTGWTNSSDFPLASPLQSSGKADGDVFVTKLSPDGRRLVYSAYIGGSDFDAGYGVAVDAAGNAYVTGESFSSDFPVVNPIQRDPGVQQDVIVVKLNASGSALVYSTYVGGVNSQTGWDIAADSAGSAYVTGHTLSGMYQTFCCGVVPGTFPVVNAYQPTAASAREAFVLKLTPAGSGFVYSTYLGGTNDVEYGQGIAVDAAGDAYVVGYTASSDFPTANALQPSNAGFDDVFVAKFNPPGSALLYSTYLGGSSNDQGSGIALDAAGNVYLTGDTDSTDFPLAGPVQGASAGHSEAFVAKLNAPGSALLYSTYLGGAVNDYGREIAVDAAGGAYVAGWTRSPDFPTVNANAIQPCVSGDDADAFVAKLNAPGSALAYSTYLGGWVNNSGLGDYAYGIAVDGAGNAFVTGYTYTHDFPVAGAPLQPANAGSSDAFVARVGAEPAPDFSLCRDPSARIIRPGATARYTVTLSSGNGFAGSVSLSVSGLPSNLVGSFSSNPVTLAAGDTASTTLSVKTRGNEPDGTYTLRISASGGGKTHARDVKFTVIK